LKKMKKKIIDLIDFDYLNNYNYNYRTHKHTHTNTHTQTHARAHTNTHTHTNTQNVCHFTILRTSRRIKILEIDHLGFIQI